MRKISIKRKKELDEYKEIRLNYLQEHEFCEVCQVEPSDQIHHKQGRNGKRLNDTNYFLACCWACHQRIEYNREWSYANGFLLKRNTPALSKKVT